MMTIEEKYMRLLDEVDLITDKSTPSELARLPGLYLEIEKLEDALWLENLEAESEKDDLECPICGSFNIIHNSCGENAALCTCVETNAEFYCFNCSELFNILEEITLDEMKTSGKQLSLSPVWQVPIQQPKASCVHNHQRVELCDGTVVHCTERNQADRMQVKPDFGLYADPAWVASCLWRNEIINWPDMSLPRDFDLALDQIQSAFDFAYQGDDVDIGCLGAHGRTGTILAIMQLLASEGTLSPLDCCQWVWDNYCPHAIETKQQEWFVVYASGYFYGKEVPSPPLKSEPKAVPPCSGLDHYAMFVAGRNQCAKNSPCKWWVDDRKSFEEENKIAGVEVGFFARSDKLPALLRKYNNE